MPFILIENDSLELQTAMKDEIKSALKLKEDITIEEICKDPNYYIAVTFEQKNEEIHAALSQAITNYILHKQENIILKKIIEKNYGYFNSKEKSIILEKAIFNKSEYKKKYELIYNNIYEYLASGPKISVNGFINFRLKEYYKVLEYTVDAAVESFLAEKEYEEFISLLRFFVSIQDSKLDTLHVFITAKNEYKLYNENKEEITNKCYIEFYKEYPFNAINSDDFLISTLINLAPGHIVLHREDRMTNNELKNTILKVFEKRVDVCPGCTICTDWEHVINANQNQKTSIDDLHFH